MTVQASIDVHPKHSMKTIQIFLHTIHGLTGEDSPGRLCLKKVLAQQSFSLSLKVQGDEGEEEEAKAWLHNFGEETGRNT